jgi:hypothetical protein
MADNYQNIKRELFTRLDEINNLYVKTLKSRETLNYEQLIDLLESDKYFIENLIEICKKRKRY